MKVGPDSGYKLENDWFPVAVVADCAVDRIRSVQLLGRELVVWRWGDGEREIAVFEDRCPHRAVKLSLGEISGGELVCCYHGWRFDPRGTCQLIPTHPDTRPSSKAHLESYPVRELYGLVWVCIGKPTGDPPAFPEWDVPGVTKMAFGPYDFQSSAFRVIENAFDLSHFAFLHSGALGSSEEPRLSDFEVTVDEGGVRMDDIRIWQPNIDGAGHAGEVTYRHHVARPLTLYTEKSFKMGRETALFTITPVTEERAVAWGWATFDYTDGVSAEEFRSYQDRLYEEDVVMVESQRPRKLPLLPNDGDQEGPRPEVHVLSDKGAVAYRRWLRKLDITYGTL